METLLKTHVQTQRAVSSEGLAHNFGITRGDSSLHPTTPNRPIQTLVVDDHAAIVNILKLAFTTEPAFQVVGGVQSVNEALKMLPSTDLLITDLQFGHATSGIDLIREAREINPKILIVVYSGLDSADIVREVINLDVNAYILKPYDEAEVVKASQAVLEGKIYYSPELTPILAKNKEKAHKSEKLKLLTEREIDVMVCLADDLTTKAIASKLNIAPPTVAVHRQSAIRKLEVNGVIGLIHYCYEFGLLKPGQ